MVHTPYQAPKANAFAERWVRSVREECLDHVLIVNEKHLHRVLKEYGGYFNHSRPHQALRQHFPVLYPSKTMKVQSKGEMFWEESFTIIAGIFPMKIMPMDDISIYYRPHRIEIKPIARDLQAKWKARRSGRLNPLYVGLSRYYIPIYGAPEAIRTPNRLIRRGTVVSSNAPYVANSSN